MLRVGLTGSIAVGKTYVCDILRELGLPILDADDVSRRVVAPETEGLKAIVKEFGVNVLLADGSLDRATLGTIVFGDEAKRLKLNAIVHPLVMAAQDAWLSEMEQAGESVAVIDAALMIESGGYRRMDKLILVTCAPAVQKKRLMDRNGYSEAEADARIGSQMSQEEKRQFADFEIDTTDGFESTKRQVQDVFKRLTAVK